MSHLEEFQRVMLTSGTLIALISFLVIIDVSL